MEIFGYEFKDERLLREALTTPSCKMDEPGIRDNQRLEFLGDAVLGLLAGERLYRESQSEEGELTIRRTHMVSASALCAAAVRHGLSERLVRNHGAAPLPENSKTLADAVEAILGAAYLDGGLAAAAVVFAALGLSPDAPNANPKGELQIYAQAMNPPRHPEYELLGVGGKAHEPVFTVRVTVEGFGSAEASAHSRKVAEALAAAELLAKRK